MEAVRQGLVVASSHGGEYQVDLGQTSLSCRLRGRLKDVTGNRLTHLAVGDRVTVRPSSLEPERGSIESVAPRTSELSRGRPGKPPQLIVANIDQLVVVVSCGEPELSLARVDRFLALAGSAGVPALIVLNKTDLDEDGEVLAEVQAIYPPLGVAVLPTCAVEGRGLKALDRTLTGRISAVVGPSGAGKSSLLNGLNPGYQLRTGEVMDIGKGRHTTTSTRLLPLDRGGWVADTPGIKTVALLASRVSPETLDELFPELAARREDCRFADCRHINEPDCAVRAAARSGEIGASRYASYARLFEELKAEDR
jgi:ribosome biogenesis GTPase